MTVASLRLLCYRSFAPAQAFAFDSRGLAATAVTLTAAYLLLMPLLGAAVPGVLPPPETAGQF